MAGENTGTADFLPKNNEEWLVWKAKDCLKTDPYAAKSWLLTARTLYPRNFTVQYEAYTIEKNSRNIEEVAKILKEMFVNFPQEPMLWQEVKIYSEALQSEAMDAYTMFLKDVFAAFPSTLQYHLLVNVAETTHDVLQQCRLMLLVLERYPDRVPDQGVKLMESLMATEKHHQPPSPVNCYRKYLVCHVLPQVLRTCPQSSPKHLYRWLQKAIEFYVCYITQPPIQETTPLSPDLQSPTNQRFGAKKVVIPGLNEKESYIENPWAQLFGLLEMIGKHLEWDMAGFFGTTSCGAQWQRLQSLWESTSQQPSSDSSNQVKQVLYCGTILFLHCLYKYASHVDPQQFSGMTILPGHPVVLIEALRADGTGSPEHKSKKLRKEQQSPRLTASSSLPNAADLTDTFLTALQCWELLHSVEALSKDFMKLLQHWKSDSWTWLRAFEIDVLIYQGFFKEAVTKLIHERNPKDNLGIRTELQIACCQYCLGNYSQSCERVLQVVSALPMSSESASHLPAISSGRRHLQLLICKESEILPYCIQLLITCFKEKAFHTAMPDDLSLGHMLVLMQYNWSNYESLFCDIMHKIQRQGNFTYNIFFNYIINIDILEEFAHLKTQDGGKMNLDILPTSTKQITQTRTVTRGVNKGVKEDFRAALEKQVSRCGENVESVIRHFFVEERDLLQQHLM